MCVAVESFFGKLIIARLTPDMSVGLWIEWFVFFFVMICSKLLFDCLIYSYQGKQTIVTKS